MPHLSNEQAKPSYAQILLGRTSTCSSTTASSRSVSPNDESTAAKNDASGLHLEHSFGLGDRGADDSPPFSGNEAASVGDNKSLREDYPEGLIVRNTFLDFAEEPIFLKMRRVKSEPSMSAPSEPSPATRELIAPRAPVVLELASNLDAPHGFGSLDVPTLGVDMPTIGSAQHYAGECKPCAFFWKPSGCSNGVQCTYCHLCDPSERKRRQKEKKAAFRAQAGSKACA